MLNSFIQIRPDILSALIWMQNVCKDYPQMTQVGKESKPDAGTSIQSVIEGIERKIH